MTGKTGGWTVQWVLALVLVTACGDKEKAGESVVADSTSSGAVRLSPEQAKAAGLTIVAAERRSAAGGFTANAQIEAAPGRLARVGARVAGRVTKVFASEGDRVPAGGALAWIDAPELAEATAQFLAAQPEAKVAREIAERERTLFERRISSEREWRQADAGAVRAEAGKESAEGRLHSLGLTDADLAQLQVVGHYNSSVAVRSPIGGLVASRKADVGQAVEPGEPLYEVVDLREVRLVVDIYEEALPRVSVGQRVEVRTTSTGDRVFPGHVAAIGAVVERETRTIKLQVHLPNPDGALRPGMFATARLAGVPARGDSGVVVIPESAVQRDGESSIVFRPSGAGAFTAKAVRLGPAADSGWISVVAGLDQGDSVVASGTFVLKSELRRDALGEGDE